MQSHSYMASDGITWLRSFSVMKLIGFVALDHLHYIHRDSC